MLKEGTSASQFNLSPPFSQTTGQWNVKSGLFDTAASCTATQEAHGGLAYRGWSSRGCYGGGVFYHLAGILNWMARGSAAGLPCLQSIKAVFRRPLIRQDSGTGFVVLGWDAKALPSEPIQQGIRRFTLVRSSQKLTQEAKSCQTSRAETFCSPVSMNSERNAGPLKTLLTKGDCLAG